MRRVISFLTIAVLLMVTACEKKHIEEPGNIPGMGNTGGKLQAEAYEFHEDLSFAPLMGVDRNSQIAALKSEGIVINGSAQGSGDQVILTLEISNNNPTECRSAWLRAGTVFEVNLEGYQNAILLAPVSVCLPPLSTKTITLYLYCLNYGKSNSDASVFYENLGVTTSEKVLELIYLLKFKKVNYEHYVAYSEKDVTYNDIKNRLQDIVWDITNRDGMDASDQAFIDELPDLPTGVFPEHIYDLNIALPDCWCLDECEVVNNSGALSYIAFQSSCASTLGVELDNNTYTSNGFPFNVERNYKQTEGTIKFESLSPALGEDGKIETATFVFSASCYDEQFTVTTKNKDEITATINIANAGEAIVMQNGFMVEFIGVTGDNSTGFTYTFNVVSDSCPGSNK